LIIIGINYKRQKKGAFFNETPCSVYVVYVVCCVGSRCSGSCESCVRTDGLCRQTGIACHHRSHDLSHHPWSDSQGNSFTSGLHNHSVCVVLFVNSERK